ncbi:hypothetical protein HXX76_001849 [Chlamydomonas incerta]|uniref:Uncharacterized protein n=1 Tax=Chlamydomonas incerta TaxID=51695 RepID=A0A835TQC5_CHLIN|nr:hypothetical protein HXX76_001849 [Chlamydomonas incerta]|eukprot:KAG2443496.1 hypothetical protein HXX76_001849 [Chlamydomonas incerta]
MLSCKPLVLRAGARRPACCADRPAVAAPRSCWRQRSGGYTAATAAAPESGGGSSAPEVQAAAVAAQKQRAARVDCFCTAACRAFPTRAVPPPQPPQPLSALPAGPLPADSIPPLLEWVTCAGMRPVAVQSILEQHCSAGMQRIVGAAARLAAAEEQEEQRALQPQYNDGVLITSAHLALAALADGDSDCAAALGVLHHSAAGLSLSRCAVLLSDRAVDERRREKLRREEARREDRGSSSSGSGSGSSSSSNSIFAAAALHFLFQSYRWAVFSGCDAVQPCHLLWALTADPRDSYSRLRADPLDECVAAAEVREPPLVWLLQLRYLRLELPRPAATYEQLLCVLRCGLDAAAEAAATTACGAQDSSSSSRGADAAAGGGDRAARKPVALHASLAARLDDVAAAAPGSTARSLGELAALLRACRLAGHVPSRTQLRAVGAAASACFLQDMCGSSRYVREYDERWRSVFELAEGFAALGYKPPGLLSQQQGNSSVQASHCVCQARPPAVAAAGLSRQVQWMCRAEAAMRFCYPESAASEYLAPYQRVMSDAADVDAPPTILQALLAVADDVPSGMEWKPVAAAALADRLFTEQQQGVATAAATTAATALPLDAAGSILACVMLQAGVPDTTLSSSALWEAATCDDVGAAADALHRAFPLPARAQLLQALGGGGGSGGAGALPSTFHVDLRAALVASLAADSDDIHATLRVQQRVGEACAAAGCGVPEGWLQQLASYSDVDPECSGDMAAALAALLKAAGAAAKREAGGSSAAAPASAGAAAATGATATSSEGERGSSNSIRTEVLEQLAGMLEAAAETGKLQPRAALAALQDLHAVVTQQQCTAAMAAAGRYGVITGNVAAVLGAAAAAPSATAADGAAVAADAGLLAALAGALEDQHGAAGFRRQEGRSGEKAGAQQGKEQA